MRFGVQNLRPLTSLRFFAAFAIVLLHAKLYMKWPWLEHFPSTLVQGVSFFFVLSGFILTHVYHASAEFRFRKFIRLRVARLWPLHVFALILVLAFVVPPTFAGSGFFDPRATFAANLFMVQSLVPYTNYMFSWNSVSWSISTEFCFYLVFPLLLVRIERAWAPTLIVSAALVVLVFATLAFLGAPVDSTDVGRLTITSATYADPLVRGFEFCLGMAAWVFWKRCVSRLNGSTVAWSAAELVALIAAGWWLTRGFYIVALHFPAAWLIPWFQYAGSAWMFAVLIVLFAGAKGIVGRALSIAPLVWLGEVSFAIYMLHQILFKIFAWRLGVTSEFLFFPALIIAAGAVHHLLEKPGRTLLAGGSRRRTLQPAAPMRVTEPGAQPSG